MPFMTSTLEVSLCHEFTIKDKTDVVFSGLGWIRVQGKADQPTIVAAWAPEGVGVVVRKAII